MMDEEEIRSVVKRLSRPQPLGALVIERAAVVAEGADSGAILAWIASHDGQPEERATVQASGGLHRGRMEASRSAAASTPRRYVLPPGALS